MRMLEFEQLLLLTWYEIAQTDVMVDSGYVREITANSPLSTVTMDYFCTSSFCCFFFTLLRH